ncbi:MAG: FAD-dependent oxidoreductase [Clostridia bacterium]|nr:FAD-dependent oxidoreductase [Clostridia bacterium]
MTEFKEKNGAIIRGEKEIPVYGEYDVVVAGGGMAGVGAAIAAARGGAKTILVENTSMLGGLATAGLVNIPLDFVSGIGREFFNRLDAMDGLRKTNSNPEKHKLLFDQMVKEAGCDLLLVTPIIDTIVDGNTVKGVIIHTKTGPKAIMGKRFVDATGDSDLVYFAGGETMTGRPEDHMSMACSLEFTMGGVNYAKYRDSELCMNDPKWVKFIAKALEEGKLPYEIDNHLNWMTHIPGRPAIDGMDEVSICFAHSRNCFPTDNDDLTRMYIEGREQAAILADFIRDNIPGFENAYLGYTGSLLGVRESRRIVGKYLFTGMDIAYARRFDDVIAISHHGYDLHGFETPGNMKWIKGTLPDGKECYISNRGGWGTQLPPDDGLPRFNMLELSEGGEYFYDIPFRSLVHVRLDNVLAAGRNISTDLAGQSGTRLVMCCMTLGESAGTAAAMSLENNCLPAELDVGALQRRLDQNGVNIGQSFRKVESLGNGTNKKFTGYGTDMNYNG